MPSKERVEKVERTQFNKAFKAALAKEKLTQRKVAKALKIDEAYLSKVARGQIEPSVVKALRICAVLKVAPADLWG